MCGRVELGLRVAGEPGRRIGEVEPGAVARDALAADRVRVISEVSRWLGHKSITTTVDLYGHLVPEGCAKDGRLRPRGAGQEEEKG